MSETSRLEFLSDKARRGEPISFLEAVAVVNYQGQLQADREARRANSLLGRLKRWFRARTTGASSPASTSSARDA